jgi:hypothetical protein
MSINTKISDILAVKEATTGLTINEKGFNSPLRVVSAFKSVTATDADSLIVFLEVPVDSKLHTIIFASDDMGTTGIVDVGFYPGNKKASDLLKADAVSQNAIGTLIDVKTAAVAPTDIRFETLNINTIDKKAWELAGLNARPAYSHFYIVGTLTEANTATGTMAMRVTYSD